MLDLENEFPNCWRTWKEKYTKNNIQHRPDYTSMLMQLKLNSGTLAPK